MDDTFIIIYKLNTIEFPLELNQFQPMINLTVENELTSKTLAFLNFEELHNNKGKLHVENIDNQ